MSMKRQAVTRLTLDMSLADAVQKSVAISKGDTNRRMEITLTDAGRPFALPSTWTVTLSGGTVEDGCVVDQGRILYDLSSGVLTSEAGIFELTFRVFDEEGDVVATPVITCNVYDAERNTAAVASTDEFSVLADFIKNINEVDTRIDNLDKRISVSMMTIAPTDWTDDTPYSSLQYIYSGDINNNESSRAASILLIPMDKYTREEAQNTELTVSTASLSLGLLTLSLTRKNDAPTVAMQFACVTILVDNPIAGSFPVSASFVGVTELPDELMEREVLRVLRNEKYTDENRVTELINESLGVIANGTY